MKRFHSVIVTVHSKEGENSQEIKQGLIELFPFNLEEEKIKINETTATGLEGKKITIMQIEIDKEKTTNQFINNFLEKIGLEQRKTINAQKETRLDNELYFFIRLDKEKLSKNKEYVITDSGNCYHIKLRVAAFPKTKEKALQLISETFSK